MKINRFFASLAAGFVLIAGLSSCQNDEDFLKEHSYQFDEEGFFQTEQTMEIGLASAYTNIGNLVFGAMRTWHSWMLMGVGLDTFAETSGTDHMSNWASMTPQSGYARHWPDFLYNTVNRVNTVVDMIDAHPNISYSTPTKKAELRAEAVFLRAWAYRILAGMYGTTVYSEHRTTEAKYDYTPNTRQETWEHLYDDFKYAEENLPLVARAQGTPCKAAAAHYLSEICLALGKFAEAEAAATRVIDGTDGNFHIMTSRFGYRASQATDRYGNTLNPYWDLFRSSAKPDGTSAGDSNMNHPDNKEAIWVSQQHFDKTYDAYPDGATGDGWWRTHFNALEASWTPTSVIYGNTTLHDRAVLDADGKPVKSVMQKNKETDSEYKDSVVRFYVWGADGACYKKGVSVAGASKATYSVTDYRAKGSNGKYPTIAIPVEGADGRLVANVPMDSLGGKPKGNGAAINGNVNIPCEYVYRYSTDVYGGLWDDVNDFRGSEVMIQRDPYVASGKHWSEVKAAAFHRQDSTAAIAAAETDPAKKKLAEAVAKAYKIVASDTTNIFPRFWKFSEDIHPNFDETGNKSYDCDWYLIRIAETYLLRAEARLAQGNKAGAAEDINVLRSRAGASDVAASQVDIDYILDERTRELFGEEERWITLNRLSVNPNCGAYVTSKYPVQDETTSNTMYERVRKYGFGYENLADNPRETYTDVMGKTRHYSNFKPYNYVLPIPFQIIQANKDYEYPQNTGY